MSDDIEGLDFALLSRFPPRAAQTIKGRKKLEKKRPTDGDGRSKRATGRTAQLNLKERPEWRAELITAAGSRGMLMVEFVELMFEQWKGENQ